MDKGIYWYYIDGQIVGIAAINQSRSTALMGPPPYGVVGPGAGHYAPSTMPTLVELICDAPPLSWDISEYIAVEAEEKPPTALAIYNEDSNTQWRGMAVLNGVPVTSHAFPLFGYAGKTIDFQATVAGTLFIDVLLRSNNWRIYPPNAGTAIVANQLENFPITGDEVFGRLRFTPGGDGEISDAEVHLR